MVHVVQTAYPGYNQKGGIGPAKIDVGAFVGLSGVMRKTKVLDAGQYRAALKSYNARRLIPVPVIDPQICHQE